MCMASILIAPSAVTNTGAIMHKFICTQLCVQTWTNAHTHTLIRFINSEHLGRPILKPPLAVYIFASSYYEHKAWQPKV